MSYCFPVAYEFDYVMIGCEFSVWVRVCMWVSLIVTGLVFCGFVRWIMVVGYDKCVILC